MILLEQTTPVAEACLNHERGTNGSEGLQPGSAHVLVKGLGLGLPHGRAEPLAGSREQGL